MNFFVKDAMRNHTPNEGLCCGSYVNLNFFMTLVSRVDYFCWVISVAVCHIKSALPCPRALFIIRLVIFEMVLDFCDYGGAVAEQIPKFSHWCFLFFIRGCKFTLDGLLCYFSKLVIGKTLTMGLQQFLNIVLINILQFCFIGQFDNVLDDCFLIDFLLVLLMQFGVTSFQATLILSVALIML